MNKIVFIIVFFITSVSANTGSNDYTGSRLVPKFFSALGTGGLAALGGGMLGGFVGTVSSLKGSSSDREFALAGGFAIGAAAGYTIGNPLGVYLKGKEYGENGNYWVPLLFSASCVAGGILVGLKKPAAGISIYIVGIPIGSVGGYQLSKRLSQP